MRMLKGPNRIIKNVFGVDVDKAMRIKGKKGYFIPTEELGTVAKVTEEY